MSGVRTRSKIILDAKSIMRNGLLRTCPTATLDGQGYVADWRLNLLSDANVDLIEADLREGKGGELGRKFCAAHSSAALAVNAFGPFRDGVAALPMPGVGDIRIERFERIFPTGLGGTPPHLDVSARGDLGVVAIESKCLEHLTPEAAGFAPAYQKLTQLRGTTWFAEMERLRAAPRDYEALDAAQLVKHAFGLMNSAGKGATLVYLFWEPDDAGEHDLFRRHREEIARFHERTRSGRLRFVALSYPELWDAWSRAGEAVPNDHADLLRVRYGGQLDSLVR